MLTVDDKFAADLAAATDEADKWVDERIGKRCDKRGKRGADDDRNCEVNKRCPA